MVVFQISTENWLDVNEKIEMIPGGEIRFEFRRIGQGHFRPKDQSIDAFISVV